MTQRKYTTGKRTFQHLTKEKRAQIEILLRQGLAKTQIAKAVGIARSTLYRELARGTVEQLDSELRVHHVYFSDTGQRVYEENRKKIEENAKILNIKLDIFESDIFDSVYKLNEGSPCYLCARMRRGCLYNYAKKIGCNKIALGHHFDDVIETTLLSIIYGGEIKGMMPKLHSDNFPGMELIRPLYLVREKDIKAWARYNKLEFLNCACRFTEKNSIENNVNSKRIEIKKLIKSLEDENKNVPYNIFRSCDNVNLDTLREYKTNGVRHNFLENYDKKEDE